MNQRSRMSKPRLKQVTTPAGTRIWECSWGMGDTGFYDASPIVAYNKWAARNHRPSAQEWASKENQ